MGTARTTASAAVLVVEAGLAVLGILVHYSFTAEYGVVTDLAVEGWRSRLSSGVGVGGVGLVVVVVVVALVAVSVAAQRWARLTAVAIPVLMVGGLLVLTPAALRDKLESQYDDTPQ